MSKLKKIFFTSDLHIGHANVIKFDQRPFTDLDHMHRVMINNFNSTVPTDGITYFLGDIGFDKGEIVKTIINQLNGTKVLILGNHDKGANAMYNSGFDVVLNSATLYICNKRVTLSHCPLKGVFRELTEGMKNSNSIENWHGENRHNAYSVTNEGQFHLHGHIHSGPANDKKRNTERQYDVGMPGNQYRPVSMSTIESWIQNEVNKEQK